MKKKWKKPVDQGPLVRSKNPHKNNKNQDNNSDSSIIYAEKDSEIIKSLNLHKESRFRSQLGMYNNLPNLNSKNPQAKTSVQISTSPAKHHNSKSSTSKFSGNKKVQQRLPAIRQSIGTKSQWGNHIPGGIKINCRYLD